MSLHSIKLDLIKEIANLDDSKILTYIRNLIVGHKQSSEYQTDDILKVAMDNIPEKVDLDILQEEQAYSSQRLHDTLQSHNNSIWEDEKINDLISLLK